MVDNYEPGFRDVQFCKSVNMHIQFDLLSWHVHIAKDFIKKTFKYVNVLNNAYVYSAQLSLKNLPNNC